MGDYYDVCVKQEIPQSLRSFGMTVRGKRKEIPLSLRSFGMSCIARVESVGTARRRRAMMHNRMQAQRSLRVGDMCTHPEPRRGGMMMSSLLSVGCATLHLRLCIISRLRRAAIVPHPSSLVPRNS